MKRSFARHARMIPPGQIAESSRPYPKAQDVALDAIVQDIVDWLSKPGNFDWLLIFDNAGRGRRWSDIDDVLGSYDIRQHFPVADQGSILITTRIKEFSQLGPSWKLGKMSNEQARDIFHTWCDENTGEFQVYASKVVVTAPGADLKLLHRY